MLKLLWYLTVYAKGERSNVVAMNFVRMPKLGE